MFKSNKKNKNVPMNKILFYWNLFMKENIYNFYLYIFWKRLYTYILLYTLRLQLN